ncbi:MAG: glycosyltransferase family 4 protein [Acidobacteria bacterium]|nr:glycosyltransferase family 4 protein [Acidobacteriota bacterium]
MRLAVCGPGHPFRGGIAATTTRLVLALEARGHEVAFLTPVRQYPRWLYPGRNDRDPDACPQVDGARPILDPFAPLSYPATRAALYHLGADAWIFPYWTWAWAPLWLFLLAGSGRPPVIAIVHNPADHDAHIHHKLAAALVLGRCDGLFTHAERLAESLRMSFPARPVASFPLPPGEHLDLPDRTTARRELGLGADEQIALFLGLIRPYKGLDILLRAAARLPTQTPWRFVVAGEPWARLGPELTALRQQLGVEDRVRLDLGWIPQPRMAAYFAAADLLVLPYRAGSQSAVAPLALAHGIPVLSTAVGGLTELIEDGVNGILVPPGDPVALAAAFNRLDPERLARLAAGARASADALTWDAYAASLERLLATVESSNPV